MGRNVAHIEGLILLPMVILCGFSLAVIGSINPELLKEQVVFFIIGFTLFFIVSRLDGRLLQNLSWFLYGLSIFFLAISFFGPSIRGATRWINIFGVQLQPSELVKPLLLVSQAAVLAEFPPNNIRRISIFFLLFLLPTVLVLRQPDLGNSIIYAGTLLGLLFMANMSLSYFGLILVLCALFIPLSWHFLHDYQRSRIVSFINPYFDTKGAGYNAIQAMIAVGAGQLLGRGLGRGTQSQLRFLPENHTDFIFASVSEELGFVAGTVILIAYGVLLLALLYLAHKTPDRFSQLFIYGAFIQIFLHVLVNVGMNLGILPITGITLPLLSYGGSSILSTCITLGFVHAVISGQRLKKTIAIG